MARKPAPSAKKSAVLTFLTRHRWIVWISCANSRIAMGRRKVKQNERRLPVYNEARMLYEQFCRSTKKLPVNLKRGKIAETEGWIIDLIDGISMADDFDEQSDAEKLDLLNKCIEIVYRIMIRVRTLRGINMLSISGFSAITIHEDSLARQLNGWAASIEKQ